MIKQTVFYRTAISILILILFLSCDTTKKDWEKATEKNTIEAYAEFLSRHFESEYDSLVVVKITEILQASPLNARELTVLENMIKEFPANEHLKTIKKIKVNITSDLFPDLIDCNDDLAKIPDNVELKIFEKYSMSGPTVTYQLSNGKWVCCLPDPKSGKIKVSGTIESIAGSIRRVATVGSWVYIYSDSLSSSPIGWAISLTDGEVVLPISVFKNNLSGKFIKNNFEITKICKNWLIVNLNPEKKHKLSLEITPQASTIMTANYSGSVMSVFSKQFQRETDGWYFKMQKK